jgi:histidine kinase
MVTFLEAEKASLRGRGGAARRLYQEAARVARQQEYVHHAALAQERQARSFFHERRETEAAAALREAVALYEVWGAAPKASALVDEHRKLVGQS